MNSAAFIAGDWGTTHLRLYLCNSVGDVLATVEGPGVANAKGNHSALLQSLIAPWQSEKILPVVLCGMVGSTIGWKLVEPVVCPVLPQALLSATVATEADHIRIVPGLKCRNIVDAPDFMRGEETQILGAMQLNPLLQAGRHLLCLPGTHTKWVVINEGLVEHFITAPAGELFALLCKHSVLVNDAGTQLSVNATSINATVDSAFNQGVEQIMRFPQAGLLGRIFECRSRRLSGELDSANSPSFLSGLLVASDVKDALALLSPDSINEIVIIGNSSLGALYQHALRAMNHRAIILAGDKAVRAGLARVYQHLYGQSTV